MNEGVRELIKALKEAETTQIKQQALIDKLSTENTLLSETITNKKLGRINEERRSLYQRVRNSEEKEHKAVVELQEFKKECTDTYNECKDLMSELRNKKAEIDAYINAEAKKLVEQQEAALLSQYADKKKHLENQYTEKENHFKNKISVRNKFIVTLSTCIIILIAYIILWG